MADSKGINPSRFATEVRAEAKKVTWTPWRETVFTTIGVFVMVTLAAVFIYLVDLAMNLIVKGALHLGGAM
jgi:preprotein translocase subunit SecE